MIAERPTNKSVDSNTENYISNDDIGNITLSGFNKNYNPTFNQNSF